MLDPSPNENYHVSFAQHETTFTKNYHLKWEEILKIDRLKYPKSLISNKNKQKLFLQK